MGEQSKIAWTDSTLNFWEGCSKISDGCANCYAEARDKRFCSQGESGEGFHWGPGVLRRKSKSAVKEALRLNRNLEVCDGCGEGWSVAKLAGNMGRCPKCSGEKFHRRRIFSLSLGDWLDFEVPIEWLCEMLDTIRRCDAVEWILCTKRPELWRKQVVEANEVGHKAGNLDLCEWLEAWLANRPPSNITLLASVENQAMADLRIPQLLAIPAARRGLSLEPLLGPVDLTRVAFPTGVLENVLDCRVNPRYEKLIGKLHGIDWIIAGGESGANARPCSVDWIRSLVHQGQAAGVPVFVKQMGAFCIEEQGSQRRRILHDAKKGGDPSEWPEDLRVREWPKGQR